jgi:protein-S-isoprenylcysteine O-methyltransferase Ste14
MTTPMPHKMDLLPWYVFAAYWVITALHVKRTKRAEKLGDRMATIIVMVAAYALLFYRWESLGILNELFVPVHAWIAWTGLLLTWAGVAIAIWARRCLGEFWSGRVTLKEGHRLIRSGPYRFVRHPIYTGLLLGAVGRTITIGEWRGMLAVVLIFVAHSRKAQREEGLLTNEFGDEYTAYRRGTGFLFPRFLKNSGMNNITGHF